MKDILITVETTSTVSIAVCKKIAEGLAAQEIPTQQPIETIFLLSGSKAFEGASLCHHIASENKLPIAIFEIESTLLVTGRE